MPVFEFWCEKETCAPFEKFFHPRQKDDPNPDCECGARTVKLVSSYNPLWTGTLDKYFDPKCSRVNQTSEGHIAYRVRSSRLADGSPEPVHISNRQQMVEFAKAESLVDPFDIDHHGDREYDSRADESKVKMTQRGVWA